MGCESFYNFLLKLTICLSILACICVAQGEESCPTKCKGMDASGCNCGDRADTGTFSCPTANGECQHCSRKRSFCKFNGTKKGIGYGGPGSKESKCCDAAGENPQHISCQKSDKYNGRFVCLPICSKYTNFVKCTDKYGQKFEAAYKSCSAPCSRKMDTWTECPLRAKDEDWPRECGTTGAPCMKNWMNPVDDCCTGFYCEGIKCVPECKEGDDKCNINFRKEICADVDSVNKKFVTCKDSNGVEFKSRFVHCRVKTNTWKECTHETQRLPRECGATGATCSMRAPCCLTHTCNLEIAKCEVKSK